MSVDDFFVALLKLVPYEVLTAWGIIRTAYSSLPGATPVALLLFDVALTVGCLLLYRQTVKSTWAAAISLAVCFLLVVVSIDASTFAPLPDGAFFDMPMWFRVMFRDSINPFYLVGAAVLICLSSSALRGILGKH